MDRLGRHKCTWVGQKGTQHASANDVATAPAIKYEKEAIRAYVEEMKVKHINFKVTTKRYCCSYR